MAILFIIAIPFLAALLSIFISRDRKFWLEYLALAAAAGELIAILWTARIVLSSHQCEAFVFFSVDSLGLLLLLLIGTVGFAATIHSIGYLRKEMKEEIISFRQVRQYFILLHLFLFAMFLAVVTASPIMMWIAIEATTLSTAFLINFYKKPLTMEAAWKYLILNSVGLLLGFLGTLLFICAANQAGLQSAFLNFKEVLGIAPLLNPLMVKLALIFIFVGYGTKAGFVPMHTWLPDAHSKAPTPISALLSGVLLNVAFFAILRFKTVADQAIGALFSQKLYLFFGAISILVAALIILIQKNYKRLLAYSSIEHFGIMSLGFGFGGVGTFAALMHMVYHSLVKSLLFFVAGNIFLKYKSTNISDVRGVFSTLPFASIFLVGGFLAITGFPPFGLFFTKFYILSVGIKEHPWIVAFTIIALSIVFISCLKYVSAMFFGSVPEGVVRSKANPWMIIPPALLAVLFIILSLVIPDSVQTIISEAASLISQSKL